MNRFRMMMSPQRSFPVSIRFTSLLIILGVLVVPRLNAAVPFTVTNRPGPIFRQMTNAVPPVVRSTPTPTNQDPLNALMTSAASIDMESPVIAQAEFDPPVIAFGQRTIYRLVLNAMNESTTLPDKLPVPDGLQVIPGGRGQIYQPAAGKIQPRTSLNFSVTARTNGTFVMPSFTVMAYGKSVKIPEAKLTVVPTSNGMVTHEAPRMIMELPQGDIYVGQSLRIRVLLPDRGDGSLLGLSQVRVTGDSLINEPVMAGQRRDTIQRNGRPYLAFVQEVTVTPMASGKQTLIAQGHAVLNRTMPGQVGVMQTYQVLLDSDPVTVDILSLPKEGQLPGFTGAIGTFQLDPPKLTTNEVRAGDLVSLTVGVRGDGNIGRLVPPPTPFLRDWQIFPPTADPTPAYAIQQRGMSLFTYTLIPLNDRIAATPAIPFSYYDPKRKQYVDLTIPPVPVKVKPAPGVAANAVTAMDANPPGAEDGPREPELALTGLAESPGMAAHSLVPSQSRPWFPVVQILPALALVGLVGWDKRRRYLAAHPELVHKRQARRELRRQMRLARRAAQAGDAQGYITGALNSLRAACAPMAKAKPEALVCADVLRELPPIEQHGAGGTLVRRLFSAADAHRFGGVTSNGADLLATRRDLERVVHQLQARL